MATDRAYPESGLLPGILSLAGTALWGALLASINAIFLVMLLRRSWEPERVLEARIWLVPLALGMAVVEVVAFECSRRLFLWGRFRMLVRRMRRVRPVAGPDYDGWELREDEKLGGSVFGELGWGVVTTRSRSKSG